MAHHALGEDKASRYNVILILVDQERYFSSYPFPVDGRERLMRQGITFTRHQNCSNVCTSSRSVVYTGWHMPITGMFDNVGLPWMTNNLDPALGTIGSLFRQTGYYAAYKGKWHLSNELEGGHFAGGKPDIGLQPSPHFHTVMDGYGFSDYHGIGDVIGWSQGGYLYDEITAAQTVSWLRGTGQTLARQGENWFLAINLVNPHDVMFIDTDEPGTPVQWQGKLNDGGVSMNPAQPPDHPLYQARWDNVPLPESRHQPFDDPGRPAAHREYQRARAALVGDFVDEDRRWRKLQDYYFNCIRDCDRHVVTILDELDALGLMENSVIMFTADHGELGGYHGMHGKGSSIYREQMQVPMIVAHPAVPGGGRCDALTCHLDVVPTLLALSGIPQAERDSILSDRRGRDFSPLLDRPQEAGVNALRPSSLYCFNMLTYADADYLAKVQAIKQRADLTEEGKKRETGSIELDLSKRSAIRCVNDGRYKFARYFSPRQHNSPQSMDDLLKFNDIELFDTRDDPDETNNLAQDTERNAALIMEMSNKLEAIIRQEVGEDDGGFLPLSGLERWNLDVVVE
ncbi:sulfatase-like hydrolase/transferase [Novosphingobium panipatense]|uniref:Arylsulfatase A n=1 Tax=Novosphingobium panipatense TaxID=428991 RepID=A0ABY1QAX2_9SPHN|nr:sulfatase-like hydrolase/transferase [Novosphingobium panipatense]SMP61480.1 Arylsulfatase A [Novosphingobium panipatense]